MIEERILDKIKKCLALSASPEPEEAAAALRQAQKLMAKYGVSQIDLSMSDIGEINVKAKTSVSRMTGWELRIMQIVAEAFGCRVLWVPGVYTHRGHYILIGLKTQLPLAQYTCEVLQRKLINARGRYVKTLPEWWSKKEKRIEADGFCHGWLSGVAEKVTALAHSDETKQLIDKKVADYNPTKPKDDNRRIGYRGYADGEVAGADESLYRPMEQSAPNAKLN